MPSISSIRKNLANRIRNRRERKSLISPRRRARISEMNRSDSAVLHHYVEISMRRNRIQDWFERQKKEIYANTKGQGKAPASAQWSQALEQLSLRQDKRVADLILDIAGINGKAKRAELWGLMADAQKKRGNLGAQPAFARNTFQPRFEEAE